MWSILCLCFFIISVCAEESISTNSTNPLFDVRIIGGSPANIADHPYQVALIKDNYFWCGGSLIQWNWVLTAAHCSYGVQASQVKIRAGSNYWNSAGVLATVKKIIVNPTFNPRSLTHDCALMQTINGFKNFASTYSIALIGLATSVPSTDKNVILAGWGLKSMTGGTPLQLQDATMHTISRTLCASSYYIDSSMFCAGRWTGGLGSCFGDSGGGLKYGNNLIGIVSYGSTVCADKNYPSVFCSIPNVRTWILNTAI